jgi:hypothetical protein
MSTTRTPKNGDIDAILAELKPVFDQIEKRLRAVGWRRKHGRLYSPDGLTLAAECLRIQGDHRL